MSTLQKTTIQTDGETLACEYKLSNENVIILHGAGKANKQRYYSLAEEIMKRGKGVILFDFSGHGESSGKLAELSLNRRRDQAIAIIDTLIPDKSPLYFLGFSMSGQTVCDLLPKYGDRTKSILLGNAAMYRQDVYDLPFGSTEFTNKIRQGDWETSRALEYLAHYEHKTIVAIGDQDEVIPRGVTQLFYQTARRPLSIEYAGVSHSLGLWLNKHPSELEKLVAAVLSE